jgi:hypothetical protein
MKFCIGNCKIFKIQDLAVSFFLILCLICQTGISKQLEIQIKEDTLYRTFLSDKKFLIINKINNGIYFKFDKTDLRVNQRKQSTFYTFQLNKNQKVVNIYYLTKINKKTLVGYHPRESKVYYYENSSCNINENRNAFNKLLSSAEIVEGIVSFRKISGDLISKSCASLNEESYKKLKSLLTTVFRNKNSNLVKCVNSEKAINLFKDDPVWGEVAGEVFGRYTNLISRMTSGESPLKIVCSGEIKNKVASFNEKENEISLAMVNGKLGLENQNGPEVLFHELIHYGSQHFQCKENSSCLDEKFATNFSKICNLDDLSVDAPLTSGQIIEECALGKVGEKRRDSFTTTDGSIADFKQVAAVASSINSGNIAQAGAVSSVLASGAATIQPVNPADLAAIAGASVSLTDGRKLSAVEGDGEFHRVVADSGFTERVRNVFTSLTDSVNNTDAALDSALTTAGAVAGVAVGAKAVASVANGGSFNGGVASFASGGVEASMAPMTPVEAFVYKYLPNNKVIEDPKLDSMNYSQKMAYFKSLVGASEKEAPAAEAAPLLGLKAAGKDSRAPAIAGVIDKTNSGASARAIASLAPSSETSSFAKSKNRAPEASGQLAGDELLVAAPVAGTIAKQTSPLLDNTTLQKLSNQTVLKGSAYSYLINNITDQKLQRLLDSRGIRIFNESGRPYWTSKVEPQRCFRDQKLKTDLVKSLVKVKCE